MEGFNPNELSVGFEKIKPKYHYVYTDGNVLGCPVIYQFDADDQVQANEKFYEFIQNNNIDISQSDIRISELKN